MILRIRNIHAYYGDSHVLHGVDMDVPKGAIVCLLGRNGMGKTTLMRTIMGLARIGEGSIHFAGNEITGMRTHHIARLGISYVPENRGIFPELTLWDNLFLGTLMRRRAGAEIPPEIFDYFPMLGERMSQEGGSLSGGEQQMLSIARGLVGEPQLLLIDEFSEGLQPSIVQRIARAISRINRQGISILLVEQNVRLALELGSYAYIMSKGRITYAGRSDELGANEKVLQEHLVM